MHVDDADPGPAIDAPEDERAPWWKVAIRLSFTAVALGVSLWIMARVFDDFDLQAVFDTVRALTDAELLALGVTWVLLIASQGLMTGALNRGLPVRRGVLAYLGPVAVSSLIPGPSDLPVRYRMFTSWGISPDQAKLSVAANGIFSIGTKLVLPGLAGLVIVVSELPVDGVFSTIATISLIVLVLVLLLGGVLGSTRTTARAASGVSAVWAASLRVFGREVDRDGFVDRVLAARSDAIDIIRTRWPIGVWASFLIVMFKVMLLLMALRFGGVTEDELPWYGVFVAVALVEGLTALPITAGNVGVAELGLVGFLTAAGPDADVNVIAAAVLVYRALTWLLLIPVGFGAIGVWRLRLRRRSSRPI